MATNQDDDGIPNMLFKETHLEAPSGIYTIGHVEKGKIENPRI